MSRGPPGLTRVDDALGCAAGAPGLMKSHRTPRNVVNPWLAARMNETKNRTRDEIPVRTCGGLRSFSFRVARSKLFKLASQQRFCGFSADSLPWKVALYIHGLPKGQA